MFTGSSSNSVFLEQKLAFSLGDPRIGHSPHKNSTNQKMDVDALGNSPGKARNHRSQDGVLLIPIM